MAGVTAGLGDWAGARGALGLLGVNVLSLVIAGCATLIVQRFVGLRMLRGQSGLGR